MCSMRRPKQKPMHRLSEQTQAWHKKGHATGSSDKRNERGLFGMNRTWNDVTNPVSEDDELIKNSQILQAVLGYAEPSADEGWVRVTFDCMVRFNPAINKREFDYFSVTRTMTINREKKKDSP